ncbi:MAG: ABC transporter ATP-binding protein [Alphaproteobacteria bacterium]|nr:ABC transporter ATP-binding protein [Alphaproteobacteria bacterium]
MSSSVRLKSVSCAFSAPGKNHRGKFNFALDAIDLEVRAGEFFTLLGPSGSGKTTCLRVIGGFVAPNAGEVYINGRNVTHLAANEREVTTVFQDYGLFPHLTVLQNVAYGLMVRGVQKSLRIAKSRELLAMVRLPDVEDRKPLQLSGGQQQRVALARALVVEPKVLLLDEPLGALDLKLREEMQIELKAIQRQLGVTFVFVTHDQSEALSLSDRIGVFNQGKVVQVGSASDIYNRPTNRFVAEFIGSTNLFEQDGGKLLMVRPEMITIGARKDAKLHGVVRDHQYLGSVSRLFVEPLEGDLRPSKGLVLVELSSMEKGKIPVTGESVNLHWEEAQTHHITAKKAN